jgi:hypothetical protein
MKTTFLSLLSLCVIVTAVDVVATFTNYDTMLVNEHNAVMLFLMRGLGIFAAMLIRAGAAAVAAAALYLLFKHRRRRLAWALTLIWTCQQIWLIGVLFSDNPPSSEIDKQIVAHRKDYEYRGILGKH